MLLNYTLHKDMNMYFITKVKNPKLMPDNMHHEDLYFEIKANSILSRLRNYEELADIIL